MQSICFRNLTMGFLVVALSTAGADDGATVRGKIAQQKVQKFQIDLTKVPLKLRQIVQIPDPPYPESWDEMKVDAQQAWLNKFKESAEGKKYIEENEKKLDDALVFDITVEADGKFVVYDVPDGQYGLRGRFDKEVGGLNHAFEVFGQVNLAKEVDELLLEPLMLTVTPLLKSGDKAPDIKIGNHDGTGEWQLKNFANKYLFIQFWSKEFSPPSVEYQAELQKMFAELKNKHKFDLLSVCLDKDREKAVTFIREKNLQGQHGFTNGWNHPSLQAYGIRRIPSFWLIDPQGRIKMTNADFSQAFASGKSSLAAIVDDRINGKDIPTPAQPPAKKEAGKSDVADK